MKDSGRNYELIQEEGSLPIKAWIRGVPLEDVARAQLLNLARLPFVYKWVAAMPDAHWGLGATVGSVFATSGAIVPAAVGVDIGCGMIAQRTTLAARDLPDDAERLRQAIERAVPHGRTDKGGRNDRGTWKHIPEGALRVWRALEPGYRTILARHPILERGRTAEHLGTLGSGNHFIELSLDEQDRLWIVLHSGSRGVGNRIGSYFIELAKKDLGQGLGRLPDQDLAYLREGAQHFDDYVHAVGWAQEYARHNRALMMDAVVEALQRSGVLPVFQRAEIALDCHHNYVARETHYAREVFVTRKGAVRAGRGELGIIPGSMGARSFITRGKGHPESFESSSHGAGRAMSRQEARRRFTLADHAAATRGVACRQDESVLDETPGAYKSIEAVMRAQEDLVEIVHTLRQVVCVKG